MKRKAGFIGLGVMGFPMAGRMAKFCAENGGGLIVYDIDPVKTQQFVAKCDGAKAAADIGEVGKNCDIVFLSLPRTAVVEEAVLGYAGLAETMAPGGLIIDCSTTEVTAVKNMASSLREQGLVFADAPVSGGEKAAVDGSLSFMVGCGEESFPLIKEFCAPMAGSVVRLGEAGAGQTAKAVNQMIVGAAFAVIAEGFSLGAKSGLDPQTLYEAIKGGWAGSKVLDTAAADMFSRAFKPGGTVDIHWKDLGYALSLAKDTDVPVPVTALVHEIFKAARARGDGKKSQSAVVRLWEDLLRQEVK